jgi:PAS domain S-box-containing protein
MHWRLEEALKKSEERFRAISDKMALVTLILDVQGNVTFCNQYLLRLIGWREDELLGRNWCDMCVPWEQYPRMRYPPGRILPKPANFENRRLSCKRRTRFDPPVRLLGTFRRDS